MVPMSSSSVSYTHLDVYKRQAYNQNTIKNVLGDMYKSPDVITQYTDQSTELWNMNRNQKDYLVERVGLGTLDVSEYITVPKIRM